MSVLFSYVLLTTSFAATPLWPQYFFAPMPFIILSFFIGLSLLQKTSFRLSALILITAIFFVTFPIQETIRDVSLITTPTQWIPVKAHQFAQQIQEIVPQGKVVSLAPIYSLEAGLMTYSPFFVGPFVWRTAPLLSAEGRQNYGLVSFHELDAMLMTNPPDAIISGFETDYGFDTYSYGMLEKPLTDYAVANQYKIYKTWKPAFWAKNITLWVRPNQ